MTKRYNTLLLTFALAAFFAAGAAAQDDVTLEPVKDNSMYEDGALSNGAGDHLFAGRTGTNVANGPWNRRALLAFDVAAAVPDNARIDSVELSLNVSNIPVGASNTQFSLHRLTSDWGEGDSDAPGQEGTGAEAAANDVTWTHAFFDTDAWDTAGGDFEGDASGTFGVGTSPGPITVESTEGLVADVQLWQDDPASNFGWIIIGDESQQHTARRFDSREFDNATRRPQLTIYYTETTASERDDLPRSLALDGNYPNPFERTTTIRYDLDKPQEVRIQVIDLTGRAVLDIDRGLQGVGPHTADLSADGLAAGMYMYCLSGSTSSRDCRSMVILP